MLGSVPGFARGLLGDLRQVTSPCYASVSPFCRMGIMTVISLVKHFEIWGWKVPGMVRFCKYREGKQVRGRAGGQNPGVLGEIPASSILKELEMNWQ